MKKRKPSVLIADDHQVIRDLVSSLLERRNAFETHPAGTFGEIEAHIEKHGPADVILLDYSMPGISGLQGVERVVSANAPNPVILFTGIESPAIISGAMDLGVRGVILKHYAAERIIEIIRGVLAGEIHFPSGIERLPQTSKSLTPREQEILCLLKAGKTNREIAEACGISLATVKFHIAGLCTKVGARNRTQAVMMAESLGLR